jgi:hypothetical protein
VLPSFISDQSILAPEASRRPIRVAKIWAMQDRPSADELLAFIEAFLDEEIVPNVPGSRGFHARVAANAIRIVRRELEGEEVALAAEWESLGVLLGAGTLPESSAALREALRDRNAELCEKIRAGEGEREAVAAHVRATVAAKLRATDPALLARSERSEAT